MLLKDVKNDNWIVNKQTEKSDQKSPSQIEKTFGLRRDNVNLSNVFVIPADNILYRLILYTNALVSEKIHLCHTHFVVKHLFEFLLLHISLLL